MANESVYFIRLGKTAYYKIGFTRNIQVRLNSIDQQVPFPVELCASYQTKQAADIERHLHRKYVNYRTYGEWFKFTRSQAKEIIAGLHANGRNPHLPR